MEFFVYYSLLGAFAGTMAGMLGIGGGLIIVPVLAILFEQQQLSPEHIMHLAIGTALATILATAISSVRAHHKRGAVQWPLFARITPGIVLGAVIGSTIAHYLPSDALKRIFGVFEILLALQIIFSRQPEAHRGLPGPVGLTGAGGIVGTISAILGMGGGALTTPFFLWCNVEARKAIATSAAIGLPMSIAGTLGYIVGGWNAQNLPEWSTGYIFWPAFLGIVAFSIVFAPLGARLAHYLPAKTLKRFFAVFLIFLGINMLRG